MTEKSFFVEKETRSLHLNRVCVLFLIGGLNILS